MNKLYCKKDVYVTSLDSTRFKAGSCYDYEQLDGLFRMKDEYGTWVWYNPYHHNTFIDHFNNIQEERIRKIQNISDEI